MQSIASLAPKQEAEGVQYDCSRPQIVMRMVDGGEKTKSGKLDLQYKKRGLGDCGSWSWEHVKGPCG